MDTFNILYFDFSWELALETWAKGTFNPSVQIHDPDQTHSSVSFQRSGLSKQQMLVQTEKCLQDQKWSPYNVEGEGSVFLCKERPCDIARQTSITCFSLRDTYHQFHCCILSVSAEPISKACCVQAITHSLVVIEFLNSNIRVNVCNMLQLLNTLVLHGI